MTLLRGVFVSKNNADFFKNKNEWSVIKDKLLGCYLTPYFQKVLHTGKPIFYVDCFAGKGKFEDGNDGSPLIALRIREDCLSRTSIRIKKGSIQTCFIDMNYAEELNKNISGISPSYDTPTVLSGKYEDNIENCLRDKKGFNVFLYIDPYGIKALDSAMFDKFKSFGFSTFEMLINFNSFGFFRDACRVMQVDYKNDMALQGLEELVEFDPTTVDSSKQSELLLSSIAGGDYWKNIVIDYRDGKIDGYQAEQRLSSEYKKRLKQRYSYVLDMPIRLKASQRPKYRMIHVCDHEEGCFLMAQNMQKRKDELFINIQQRGQISFSDLGALGSSSVEGEYYTREEIVDKIRTHITQMPKKVGVTKFIASFVNEYGLICEFKMIYEILEELQISRAIQIVREPSETQKGRPTAFWEEKKDQTVTIWRH